MKKILISTFCFFLFSGLLLAQVPQLIKFQGIARDPGSNQVLTDQPIRVKLSVLKGSPNGTAVYVEEVPLETGQNGHFSMNLGADDPDDFAAVEWREDTYFLKVEIDPDGIGTNFQQLGDPQQILTVPFALVAGNGKRLSSSNQDEFMNFDGTNGNQNVTIGGTGSSGNNNRGIVRLKDTDGDTKVNLFVSDPEYGKINTYGPNGNKNVEISVTSIIGCPDHGLVYVYDDNGDSQAGIRVDCDGTGVVWGDIKSFVMPHPNKPDKQIVYACIEGPEAAAYERGTVTLVNGEAEVQFSETFEIVANPATMTVMTSPWSAASKGLAVVERTANGFKIKELGGGTGNYKVDWEAKAVRKGWEDFRVIRDREVEPLDNPIENEE